jgi:hypothetical protein
MLLARADKSLELSEVAAFVWRLVDGRTPLHEIAQAVANEYAIDYETAYADCGELIESIADAGMVDIQAD